MTNDEGRNGSTSDVPEGAQHWHTAFKPRTSSYLGRSSFQLLACNMRAPPYLGISPQYGAPAAATSGPHPVNDLTPEARLDPYIIALPVPPENGAPPAV